MPSRKREANGEDKRRSAVAAIIRVAEQCENYYHATLCEILPLRYTALQRGMYSISRKLREIAKELQ